MEASNAYIRVKKSPLVRFSKPVTIKNISSLLKTQQKYRQQSQKMQQTGTLRKRKRRNLVKIHGLSQIPYNETEDNYDGRNLFSKLADRSYIHPHIVTTNGSDTRIRMNSSMFHSRKYPSEYSRVTRDPKFHEVMEESFELSEAASQVNLSSKLLINLNQIEQAREAVLKERRYFLDKTTMRRLRQLIFLGETTGSFPWHWNEKTCCIDKWGLTGEKLWRLQWCIISTQMFIMTFYNIYIFWHQMGEDDSKAHREMFMSSFSVMWYTSYVYYMINSYLYMDQTRQYINTLLKFNKDNVEKYLIHLDDFEDGGRLVMNGSIPFTYIQTAVGTIMFILMPYMPWFLFAYIYPKPWYWLIPGAIQQYLLYGGVIAWYSLTSWVVAAHTNSINFWLIETHHNYESDYTVEELRNPKAALEMYRGLQVLCTIFNASIGRMMIPLIKIVVIIALVPCMYVLLRSMNHTFIDEFPGILTYPLGVAVCSTSGFAILAMAAEMYDLATGFMDTWSRTKQRDFRRVLMSYPCLKMKVGSFYFVTATTTITFFKVIFDMILDCIIAFP